MSVYNKYLRELWLLRALDNYQGFDMFYQIYLHNSVFPNYSSMSNDCIRKWKTFLDKGHVRLSDLLNVFYVYGSFHHHEKNIR